MSKQPDTTRTPATAPLDPAARRGLLDYDAAAPELGCTPRMVRKLVETRQLASVKVGKLVRIEPGAITDYIDRHRRPAGPGSVR
jgi:excisionase family DNA binding protein